MLTESGYFHREEVYLLCRLKTFAWMLAYFCCQTPIPERCPGRVARSSTVGDGSSISSVTHQCSSISVQQLSAEEGPAGWRSKSTGLVDKH